MDPEIDTIEEDPTEVVDDLAEGGDGGDEPPEDSEVAANDESGEGDEPSEDDDGELSITLGDEPEASDEDADGEEIEPEKRGGLINDLRRKLKLASRESKQLRAQVEAAKQSAAPAPVVLGDKPKMSDPDIDFDEDKFSEKLEKWHERKATIDAEERERKRQTDEQHEAFQKKVRAFEDGKAKLRVPDYDDAEAVVDDLFDITQRGILVDCAKNPAALKYALGKSPAKAKELASIKNYAQFTYQLAQLEGTVKINKRNAPPPPEKIVKSGVTGAAAVENQLERLRADARNSGDYSKVAEFQRQQATKQRQVKKA